MLNFRYWVHRIEGQTTDLKFVKPFSKVLHCFSDDNFYKHGDSLFLRSVTEYSDCVYKYNYSVFFDYFFMLGLSGRDIKINGVPSRLVARRGNLYLDEILVGVLTVKSSTIEDITALPNFISNNRVEVLNKDMTLVLSKDIHSISSFRNALYKYMSVAIHNEESVGDIDVIVTNDLNKYVGHDPINIPEPSTISEHLAQNKEFNDLIYRNG